jgi:membrane associated rhomboid family serine protease
VLKDFKNKTLILSLILFIWFLISNFILVDYIGYDYLSLAWTPKKSQFLIFISMITNMGFIHTLFNIGTFFLIGIMIETKTSNEYYIIFIATSILVSIIVYNITGIFITEKPIIGTSSITSCLMGFYVVLVYEKFDISKHHKYTLDYFILSGVFLFLFYEIRDYLVNYNASSFTHILSFFVGILFSIIIYQKLKPKIYNQK